jgi:hypothetical protein
MPRVTYWNPELAKEIVTGQAMIRLRKAGNILKDQIKSNLTAAIKNPNYSRPPYKTGPHAGKWWTARDAGELRKSVRVVEDFEGVHDNILIICGNSKAYWAAMYEFATSPKRGKKFFRPALSSSRSKMKAVLENG